MLDGEEAQGGAIGRFLAAAHIPGE